ncbi:MAG: PEP-CTERM sorting domain-containing protein [Pirellulales bacterium]
MAIVRKEPRQVPGTAIFCLLAWMMIADSVLAQPWVTNPPIISVTQELYRQHPGPGVGMLTQQFNAGPGLQRIEETSIETVSDARTNNQVRVSNDNGQTWSAKQDLPSDIVLYDSTKVWEGPDHAMPLYDPRAGVLVRQWLRQVFGSGGKFYNFSYYHTSTDYGLTWGTPKQLKYEAGPDFNPNAPLDTAFLLKNNAYFGQNLSLTSEGKLIYGVGNVKSSDNDPRLGGELQSALNFTGTWNGLTGAAADYTWQASNRVTIAPTYVNLTTPVSTRGLQETTTAQLQDGRILNVWRGSNKGLTGNGLIAGGHKWFSVANSSGQSLSAVQELKYDDGTQFFSPSSLSRLYRSEYTGKLYWFGNITLSTPSGNSPRHTLVIAEVDENLLALKKSTVTAIVDKTASEPSTIQFSNFSILENRETHQIEMFLTNYGIDGAADSSNLGGDSLKFTITFKMPGDYNADGVVDMADYVVWRNNFNQPIELPNETLTLGQVTQEDYLVWKAKFGNSGFGQASGQAFVQLVGVPEPATLGLLTSALFLATLRRRHSRVCTCR